MCNAEKYNSNNYPITAQKSHTVHSITLLLAQCKWLVFCVFKIRRNTYYGEIKTDPFRVVGLAIFQLHNNMFFNSP